MEINFKTLKMRNFMSFGNVEQVVTFKQGTTFVVGENLDEGGSSGAGKSTIFSALSYVLFDKIPLKVKKERLINRFNDAKKTVMFVELEFTAGKVQWKIRRERGVNNEPFLWCDGKLVTEAGNINNKIESIIGFSYDIFRQIITFNGKSTPFLDQDLGDQRAFMEELIKITMMSRKAEVLKKDIKNIEGSIKIQLALIEQQKSMNAKLQEKIQNAATQAESWEDLRTTEVANLKTQLAKLKELKLPCTEEELAELATLKADIQQYDSALKNLERDKSQAVIAAKKLESEHAHLNDKTCPYCMQAFSSVEKLAEVIASIKREQQKQEQINEDLIPLQQEVSPLAARYAELSTRVDPREQARIKALMQSIPVTEEKLKNKEAAVNPHVAALELLIADEETVINTQELDKLKKLLAHQSILLKLLTDKNSYIRKGLISKSLPFLNKRIAFYTVKLGLPHIVLFQPDMTVEITQLGRELDHGNLSNGEKVRLNFSLCLAFRDTLSFMKSKVNLLLTDEIDGGSLDEQAVMNMISLLKHKAWDDKLGVLIISHRPEFDGRCDRSLIIRKEGGFSSLIESIA